MLPLASFVVVVPNVGLTNEDALRQFLQTTLTGVVPAALYPDAGTGRITTP